MKRLAVIFPGIGYTADKPLLYYGRRIAEQYGYEIKLLLYSGFPKKVKGNRDRMRKSCEIAFRQAEDMLADTDLKAFDRILFIGKSIGTVAAAKIAAESPVKARIRFVLFTPLEETFSYPLGDAIVFTGTGDPWVGGEESPIPELCRQRGIPCHVYTDANHSLETADPMRDLQTLREVMCRTAAFLA